jgi:K+-transporting ATPase ATPase C chain
MDGNKTTLPAVAPDGLWHHVRVSVIATLVLAVICCGIYPLVVWGLSQALFHDKANGSLITDKDGNVIGSRLIGQAFSDAKYFHPRPSAAGNGYDPTASGGSDLGPTSAKLLNGTTKPTTQPNPTPGGEPIAGPNAVDYDGIKLRVVLYCQENDIPIESSRPLKAFQDDKGNYDQAKLIEAFNDAGNPLTIRAVRQIPADAVTASASGLDPHISLENARLQAPRVAAVRKLTLAQVQQLIDQNTDGPDLGILGESGVNVLALNLSLDKLSP